MSEDALVVRLRRIEGQIRGVQKLLVAGNDEEVLNQLAAAIAGLQRVGVRLLERTARDAAPDDLLRLVRRFLSL